MIALAVDFLRANIRWMADFVRTGYDLGRMKDLLCDWLSTSLGGRTVIQLTDGFSGNPRAVHLMSPSGAADETVVDRDRWRFPLVVDGKKIGELHWELPTGGALLATPTLVAEFASAAALMLDQCQRIAEAQEQAVTDELTGLGNRRRLERVLATAVVSDRAKGAPFSVLLFDLDHFKRFNDLWGHEAGDRALVMVADLMRRVFRRDDVICRYGGEEFAVVLCDRRTAERDEPMREPLAFAERLLAEADRLMLVDDSGRMLSNITLSCGMATFPWDAGSALELLRAADAALYEAKHLGRNRICLATPRQDMLSNAANP